MGKPADLKLRGISVLRVEPWQALAGSAGEGNEDTSFTLQPDCIGPKGFRHEEKLINLLKATATQI